MTTLVPFPYREEADIQRSSSSRFYRVNLFDNRKGKKSILLKKLKKAWQKKHVKIVVYVNGSDDDDEYISGADKIDQIKWIKKVGNTLVDMEHVFIHMEDLPSEDNDGMNLWPKDKFRIGALGTLFETRASTLQSIELEMLPLGGKRSEYEDAFAKLKKIANLKSFEISFGVKMQVYDIAEEEENWYWATDTLVRTLNEMDTIEEVKIMNDIVSKEALAELCHAGNSVTGKRRAPLSLRLDHIRDCCCPQLDPAMLGGPDSRLVKLHVGIFSEKETNGKMSINEFMTSIIGALAQNTSLVELRTNGPIVMGDTNSDLEQHLRSVEYGVEQHREEWNSKLFALLYEHNNTTLAKVDVRCGFVWHTHDSVYVNWNAKVTFLLKMNGIGRRDLLNNLEDRTLWINTLLKHRQDTSVIYYLLSNNPSILQQRQRQALSPDTKKAAGTIGLLLPPVMGMGSNKKRKLNYCRPAVSNQVLKLPPTTIPPPPTTTHRVVQQQPPAAQEAQLPNDEQKVLPILHDTTMESHLSSSSSLVSANPAQFVTNDNQQVATTAQVATTTPTRFTIQNDDWESLLQNFIYFANDDEKSNFLSLARQLSLQFVDILYWEDETIKSDFNLKSVVTATNLKRRIKSHLVDVLESCLSSFPSDHFNNKEEKNEFVSAIRKHQWALDEIRQLSWGEIQNTFKLAKPITAVRLFLHFKDAEGTL